MQTISRQYLSTTLVLALGASAIAGCAATSNSGISEKGPNTYYLSIRNSSTKGGGEESFRQATAQADAYCAKSDKKAEITSKEVGPVTADVFFTCTAK